MVWQGLCLLWNKDVDIEVLSYTKNYIHTILTHRKEGNFWEFSFIYGDPTPSRRHNLWQHIGRLHGGAATPWLCLGDFNETLHSHDKVGLRPQHP